MARGRTFSTIPRRAIGDTSLSALELRCIAAIAIHDGMSLWSGKGAGCYAKHATLAAALNTDTTAFSRALSRVVSLGYVQREQHETDKRRFTLRVVPDDLFSLRAGQQSEAPEVDELVNEWGEIVDGADNKIVDMAECENGRFSPGSGPQYIPLNGKLDSVETGINSAEAAHPAGARWAESDDFDDVFAPMGSASRVSESRRASERDSAKAGLGRGIIRSRLPANWDMLPTEAQLQRFERATIDLDPELIDLSEAREFEGWLFAVTDSFGRHETIGPWAQRIYENLPWEIAK